MPAWYHRASWGLLKALYVPSLLRNNHVEARGAELIPEPPFVLMGDHSNALDAYILGSFSPVPIRYMANLEGVPPLKAALGSLAGAYGRRKGANDLSALRRTFGLARAGEAIGIFPEGDRSWDGASSGPRPGAGKLVHRLGIPLVLARQRGNYLAHPRWAERPRRGAWSVDFLVYEADELGRMSEALVESVIAAAIAKDEIKDAIREGRQFSSERSAEGVGRLLWRCPVCGKSDGIQGRGNVIACGRCRTRWELDANCRVRPLNAPHSIHAVPITDLKDWNDWQVSSLPGLAGGEERGLGAFRSEGVVLTMLEGRQALRLGRGRLSLRGVGRGAELVFEGPDARAVFKAAAVRGFVDNFNAFSEFDHRGKRWRLDFGGGNAAKWSYALSGGAGRGGPGEAA